jgi:hypothetical protein
MLTYLKILSITLLLFSGLFLGMTGGSLSYAGDSGYRVIDRLQLGGEGVDGNGFDPATGLAFSSNGSGTLTVVRESSAGRFEAADTVITKQGARTMAIDLKTHNVYLPTAQFSPPPASVSGEKKPRPVPIKDTFVVLVVGK